MRGEDRVRACRVQIRVQRAARDTLVRGVNIGFLRVGDVFPCHERPFHQPDACARARQPLEVRFSTVKVGLQRDRHLRPGLTQCLVQRNGALHVGRVFHVDHDEADARVLPQRRRDAQGVGAAQIVGDRVADLRGIDREEDRRLGGVEHGQRVEDLAHVTLNQLRRIDVFAEVVGRAVQALLRQRADRF